MALLNFIEILPNNNYSCYNGLKERRNLIIDDLTLDAGNLMLKEHLYYLSLCNQINFLIMDPILLDQDYSKFDIKIYTVGS